MRLHCHRGINILDALSSVFCFCIHLAMSLNGVCGLRGLFITSRSKAVPRFLLFTVVLSSPYLWYARSVVTFIAVHFASCYIM